MNHPVIRLRSHMAKSNPGQNPSSARHCRGSHARNYLLMMILLVLFTAAGRSQTLQSAGYGTTGYIKPDGTIQNSQYATIGYIKPDGTIQNSSYQSIGYLKGDGTVQNRHYSTTGYVKPDGTVQNSSYQTLGYIKPDGTVQNSSYSTLGYARGIKKEWAAVVFFFFDQLLNE